MGSWQFCSCLAEFVTLVGLLVAKNAPGMKALPTVTLDVMMPPTADRLRVPRGFLEFGTEYEWEVLAIEEGGIQTLSSSTFRTSK